MARPVDHSPSDARSGERIAKLLARAGIASRREIERMIADGRVAVNGVAVGTPATLLSSLDGVTVDGDPVAAPAPARLFLHHKPVGLLVTERDPGGRPTIYDRLPADLPRVVPVGRLDLNTEGLLLLTTDGGLKRQLELPATGVERAYRARAYGSVTQGQLEALIDGVEIEGVRYGSIDANLERRTGANVWIELVLTEGKNREVRRVLEHLGLRVSRLIRTRYGPFVLGDLPVGGVGEVEVADLVEFRRSLASKRGGTLPEPIEVAATPRTPARKPRPAPPRIHSGADRKPAPTVAPQGRPQPERAKPTPDPRRGERPIRPPQPKPAGARPDAEAGATRPARPQRKPGWARPKPKAGPARPRKPRG